MKSFSKNTIAQSIAIAAALAAFVVAFVPAATAGERDPHNPYTVSGLRLRSHLLPNTPGANGQELGPLVFQEIVPCRFVSTLDADRYPSPWGGEAFAAHESRTYFPKGQLIAADGWENPCSEHVPVDAIAVSLRVTSRQPQSAGAVFLSSASYRAVGQAVLQFAGGRDEMEEANVVLNSGGFTLSTDQPTHLTIDLIGYFLTDPLGVGAQGEKGEKGDKGDQGDRGEAGAQGIQGERGEKGDTGAQGLQGEKGDKGDRGETGAQGAQGERGEKGEKGDAGAQGLQGEKGDKGDRGDAGAQGLQGERGEKGDKGDAGAQGLQGEKGAKGDRGDAGAQGIQGERGQKGDKGDRGETGPQGPAGPQGPRGPKGDSGILASIGGPYVFPPGGSLRIDDPAITPDSFILLTYIEVSNGNALGVESVSNGSFVASGSPNKPFKYVVLTMP